MHSEQYEKCKKYIIILIWCLRLANAQHHHLEGRSDMSQLSQVHVVLVV